jgi:hypothetical protein
VLQALKGLIMDSTKRMTKANQANNTTNNSKAWPSYLHYVSNLDLVDIAGTGDETATAQAMTSRVLSLYPSIPPGGRRFTAEDTEAYRALTGWLADPDKGGQTGHAWIQLAMSHLGRLKEYVAKWQDRFYGEHPDLLGSSARYQVGMLISTTAAAQLAQELGIMWFDVEDIYRTGVAAVLGTITSSKDAISDNSAMETDVAEVVKSYLNDESLNIRAINTGQHKGLHVFDPARNTPYTVVYDARHKHVRIARTQFDAVCKRRFGTSSSFTKRQMLAMGAVVKPATVQPAKGPGGALRAFPVNCYWVPLKALDITPEELFESEYDSESGPEDIAAEVIERARAS